MSWRANTVAQFEQNHQKGSNLLGTLGSPEYEAFVQNILKLVRQVSIEDNNSLIEYVLVTQTSLGGRGDNTFGKIKNNPINRDEMVRQRSPNPYRKAIH
jgi:hypothetical protein